MEQHGDKLDNDLSGAPPKPSVEVICVNDHTFKIHTEQVKTSETGKSAIAFCPVCGQPARVTKRNVGRLFGFKANDTKAFNATLKKIRAAQLNVSPEAINKPPAPDLSRGKEVEIIERGGEGDEEFEAEEEETEFGGEKIRRLRIRGEEDEGDDDESEDDEGDESEDEETDDEEADDTPPRRAPKREKPKPKRRIVRPKRIPEEDLRDLDHEARRRQREDEEAEGEKEDEEESFEDRVARNRSLIDSPRRRTMIREEEFDPNKTLKEIIAESGLDEFTVERLFDYIDMQPEGWQPAQVMGMLDPWMSRSLAQRLVARYQAELYREKVRNEKEQQMMQMIGPAAGNIRLGTPGINQPLVTEGGVMRNDPSYMSLQNPQRYTTQDPRAAYPRAGGGEPYVSPRTVPRPPRTGMTDYEARELIAEAVSREVGKFQQAMLAQQREDALRKENEELKRQLAAPRTMAVDQGTPQPSINQKYVDTQNEILTMLLKHALEGGKVDLTGLLNEIRDLKKSTEHSIPGIGGAGKVSDLKDIVELQKLSNDINIAKMEFEESVEGKKFTKDLIEGALQQIGQTIAQVVAARQPMVAPPSMGTGVSVPPMPSEIPPQPEAPKPVQPVQSEQAPEKSEGTPEEGALKSYNVTAHAKDGKIEIPCPVCGTKMSVSPGDTIITCPKDPTHQFTLEPPKDVVDALTGPKQEGKSEGKSEGKPENEEPEEKKEEKTPKGQVY